MPDFNITNHAKEQMEYRNVSLGLVTKILNEPQQILTEGDKKIYQSIINFEAEGDYLVRVFVSIIKEPPSVITVYRTSKIKKYYEG